MIPLDKEILEQYIDACELIKDTKEEIGKLRKRRRQIQKDSVKGSAQEFPYTLQTYHLEGLGYATVKDPDELDRMEELLAERIRNAERIKRQVETWLNTVSPRMQRIIRYRVFDDMTWAQVAVKMGRKATEASVKMEFQRFMSAA
ncbi:RNA polymerase subunit sigma-70 [Enterocloster sp.]|uniref:RNA polymerase subunit sigma-70 n=1 Tax=Enterocloster sp. TaxID=2719315 RepID=UPI0039A1B7D0